MTLSIWTVSAADILENNQLILYSNNLSLGTGEKRKLKKLFSNLTSFQAGVYFSWGSLYIEVSFGPSITGCIFKVRKADQYFIYGERREIDCNSVKENRTHHFLHVSKVILTMRKDVFISTSVTQPVFSVAKVGHDCHFYLIKLKHFLAYIWMNWSEGQGKQKVKDRLRNWRSLVLFYCDILVYINACMSWSLHCH